METIIDKCVVGILTDQAKFEDKVNAVRLMTTGGGTVVEVAFKRGQKLDDHKAPGDALVQVLEGRVVFNLEGADTPVNAGEFFFMTKDTIHNVTAIEDSKVLLSIFAPK